MHAERAVLGAVLLYPATAPALVSFLSPAAFTLTAHRALFTAAQALLAQSEPCDPLTVTRETLAVLRRASPAPEQMPPEPLRGFFLDEDGRRVPPPGATARTQSSGPASGKHPPRLGGPLPPWWCYRHGGQRVEQHRAAGSD
ncbi:DnaB-like helicase N-terminal domain-containing protein [Streptacidiphilus cavernicola]|uniref:DnaB-like helicase N-terminal domain-containing protein n=1 Tax=Streptacidiphilus cavernicola TaxID=3342716 RepID=A0ABV6W5L4_9ACTN